MASKKPKSDHERLVEVRKKQAAADAVKSKGRAATATKPTTGKPSRTKNIATTLSEALRSAIEGSGKSANELSKLSGVPQPTITRFIAGTDMKLATAAKLAEVLNLELTERN